MTRERDSRRLPGRSLDSSHRPEAGVVRSAAIAAGRVAMERAVATEDQTERMLLVVDAVHKALAGTGLRPTVVGGLAVEYYTDAYTTSDIDVLLPTNDEVTSRLLALGFENPAGGRLWRHAGADVEWEMPGSFLDAVDEEAVMPGPEQTAVLMLRCEDVLVHRIEEFVGGGHGDVYEQALALLGHEHLDLDRVRARAAATNHDHAVDIFLDHYRRIVVEGEPAPESWDLQALADELARELLRKNRDGS